MKRNCLKIVAITAVLSVSAAVSANDVVDEEEVYAYLQCNATGWDANEANKLEPTDDPDVYVLEYTVSEQWMVSGLDQCILLVTDSPDGWGTSQQFIGTATDTVEVPGAWDLDEESSGYVSVSYPALGDYRAELDLLDMTVTVEPVDGSQPVEDVFYYLRCNATGWEVGPENRLQLDASNGLYTLDYSIEAPWSDWGDNCIITQTDEEDGWGTAQSEWGVVSGSGDLVVPEEGSISTAVVDGGLYFRVIYPAEGDFTAQFNPAAGTLTLGVQGEEPPVWDLNGEVEDLGDGRVRITYDFETPEQLEDWLPVDSEETSIDIVDGRLEISGHKTDGMALFVRALRVDAMQYEVEWLNGSHISIYLGVEWDDTWNPPVGYGLIHYYGGRNVLDNGRRLFLGGEPVEQERVYQGDILAEADGITWALDDEIMSIPLSYSDDVTKSLAIGAYSSRAVFDNIVIEGELAPLP